MTIPTLYYFILYFYFTKLFRCVVSTALYVYTDTECSEGFEVR